MNSDTYMSSTASSVGGNNNTHGELPEVSADFEMNNANSKGGASGGVQFKSASSIEEVVRIRRASNYSMEEITSYWGESNDHVLRKSELKRAVQDMYYQRRASDSDFTTLGIDDKVGPGRAVKKANRLLSRKAVMDEQDLQSHEGVLNDELMGDVYSITSTAAKREAQNKAERLHNAIVDEGN